jgi:hypothetical protein
VTRFSQIGVSRVRNYSSGFLSHSVWYIIDMSIWKYLPLLCYLDSSPFTLHYLGYPCYHYWYSIDIRVVIMSSLSRINFHYWNFNFALSSGTTVTAVGILVTNIPIVVIGSYMVNCWNCCQEVSGLWELIRMYKVDFYSCYFHSYCKFNDIIIDNILISLYL